MENDGVIDMEDEVTKFCVSWVAKKVVKVGLSYVVNSWNSHPIPGKESYCKKQTKIIMFHWMKRTFAYGSAIAVSRSTI